MKSIEYIEFVVASHGIERIDATSVIITPYAVLCRSAGYRYQNICIVIEYYMLGKFNTAKVITTVLEAHDYTCFRY